MFTAIWEHASDEVKEVLTITTKKMTYEPKDQFADFFEGRVWAYNEDVTIRKFIITLEDSLWIINLLKTYKLYSEKLTDLATYLRIQKSVGVNELGALKNLTSTGENITNNTSTGINLKDGKVNNKMSQKSKTGGTDTNSRADGEDVKKWLDVEKNDVPALHTFGAGNQLNESEAKEVTNFINNVVNKATNTDKASSTELSKNTGKTDMLTISYNNAESMLKILKLKIPPLRKYFYSQFEHLFLKVYSHEY